MGKKPIAAHPRQTSVIDISPKPQSLKTTLALFALPVTEVLLARVCLAWCDLIMDSERSVLFQKFKIYFF